jgi:hypothetical protein
MLFAKRAISLTLLGNSLAGKALVFTSRRAFPLFDWATAPLSGGVLGGVGGAEPRVSAEAIVLSRMETPIGEELGVSGL